MKPIGGFFELEKIRKRKKPFIHENALALSSGRASLNLLLQSISPSRVYVPFYTCNALLEPIILSKINYEFYHLNKDLEPDRNIQLKNNEYFMYINYFGLKSNYIQNLISRYSKRLIIDNTQAFFEVGYTDAFSFNSARKVFGVPDGSFSYSPIPMESAFPENKTISISHLLNRAFGSVDTAYQEFLEYEKSISCDIKKISTLSLNILHTIDYEEVAKTRRSNFSFLADHFQEYNCLQSNLQGNMVPFCYPLVPDTQVDKKKLHLQKIFIPTFWEDVLNRKVHGFEFERNLSRKLVPLPVDHRYSKNDLWYVITAVKKYLKR